MEKPLFEANKLIYKSNLKYDNVIVERGKVNFIVGESGSGKSTFLKLLNQSISPISGEIKYNGKAVENYNPISLRRDVSLVSQEPFLFDESILENFKQFYLLRNKQMPDLEYINYITKLCSVNVPLEQNAATLSGGERQRVYISIFLSLCPKVILLDEPTSALDESNSFKIMRNIIDFCKEKNIELVVVSHNNKIIDEFSENKIFIKKEA
jgi:putative ABC transport system ATP-binding protein